MLHISNIHKTVWAYCNTFDNNLRYTFDVTTKYSLAMTRKGNSSERVTN